MPQAPVSIPCAPTASPQPAGTGSHETAQPSPTTHKPTTRSPSHLQTPLESGKAAGRSCQKLSSHVVQRTLFSLAWEPCILLNKISPKLGEMKQMHFLLCAVQKLPWKTSQHNCKSELPARARASLHSRCLQLKQLGEK